MAAGEAAGVVSSRVCCLVSFWAEAGVDATEAVLAALILAAVAADSVVLVAAVPVVGAHPVAGRIRSVYTIGEQNG